jgi:RNA polymerase sigma factor (sigma-70 family)
VKTPGGRARDRLPTSTAGDANGAKRQPPVGRDWELLPQLERNSQILAQVLGISLARHFARTAGRLLRLGPWPLAARDQAAQVVAGSPVNEEAPGQDAEQGRVLELFRNLFREKGEVRVPLWERLAEDLVKDPDFREYVRRVSAKWLRANDELNFAQVALSFALEGCSCTVDHARPWYDQRGKLTGEWRETWINLLEAELGRKPVSRLVKVLQGRRPSEGEKRHGEFQPPYPGQAVADAAILDQQDDRIPDPWAIILRKEQVENLEAAIARLPEPQRTVLQQHFIEGRTLKAIGESLGITPYRVNQLQTQALESLQRILNPSSREDRS